MNQACYSHAGQKTGIASLLLLCSLAALAAAPIEAASDTAGPRQVTVRFADLSLTTREGAQALYARIRAAAQVTCGLEDEKDLALLARRRACTKKAIADAVTHVANAQLTAVYMEHRERGQPLRVAAVAEPRTAE